MKILLDQGLPREAVQRIQSAGHDVVHVADVGMSEADDSRILEFARTQSRIVITLDADFHALVAVANDMHPSVIRFRIEGLRADALADRLIPILATLQTELTNGALVSVQPARIRIKQLPLSP